MAKLAAQPVFTLGKLLGKDWEWIRPAAAAVDTVAQRFMTRNENDETQNIR